MAEEKVPEGTINGTQNIINKIMDMFIDNALSFNEAEDILKSTREKLRDIKITR